VPTRPGAAIDLGSTSVHLLVARPERTGLVVLADESAFLGLGEAVDGPGALGAAGRATLVATVAIYVERARALGAAHPIVMGTEPLRRLTDALRIVAEVSAAAGEPLAVLEHEEEAMLTLVGLTAGRVVKGDLLVVDIGGGSSELVEIGPGRPARAAGVQVGAGRLTRRIVDRDPPSAEHVAELRRAAHAAFDWTPTWRPAEVVFVGGTASNLLKLLRRVGNPDRGDDLGRAELDIVRGVLTSTPAEVLAATHGMREARIRLLAAGAAIIETVLDRVGMASGRVVDTGLREGAIIAADRAGVAWRDRLDELAHGWITWPRGSDLDDVSCASPARAKVRFERVPPASDAHRSR
jgi:exopolyphosphatase/guanosine-5'-triphosphate,3'-diphosphate pyrophosphatase